MSTTTANLPAKLLINSFHTQVEWFDVLSETEKAVFIRNQYSKKTAWIPKSGLKPYKPGVPTYENNYDLADWFVRRMDRRQAVCLDFEE